MEILQNSILKLIIRQGSDNDRKSIILDSGELGYTTDGKRVFIGDGFLSGGNVVGNIFKGSAPTITNVALWPAVIGDYAFASDTKKFYVLKTGTGSNSSDWLLVGGVYTSGDSKIAISNDNVITLNPLSANSISVDAIESPLKINAGRIGLNQLSANSISVDAIESPLKINAGRIGLNPLSANSISVDALSAPLTIKNGKISISPLSSGMISSDAVSSPIIIDNGRIGLSSIPFQYVSLKTFRGKNGLNVYVNGNITNDTPFNPLSSNITIESNQIYANYLGLSGQILNYNRNIASTQWLSAGHYRFIYTTTIYPEYYIPMVQIQGEDALGYQPRVIQTTLSSCDVKILDSNGNSTDANIYLIINY